MRRGRERSGSCLQSAFANWLRFAISSEGPNGAIPQSRRSGRGRAAGPGLASFRNFCRRPIWLRFATTPTSIQPRPRRGARIGFVPSKAAESAFPGLRLQPARSSRKMAPVCSPIVPNLKPYRHSMMSGRSNLRRPLRRQIGRPWLPARRPATHTLRGGADPLVRSRRPRRLLWGAISLIRGQDAGPGGPARTRGSAPPHHPRRRRPGQSRKVCGIGRRACATRGLPATKVRPRITPP